MSPMIIDPVFDLSFGHQPHPNKKHARGKGVYISRPAGPFALLIIDQEHKNKGSQENQHGSKFSLSSVLLIGV